MKSPVAAGTSASSNTSALDATCGRAAISAKIAASTSSVLASPSHKPLRLWPKNTGRFEASTAADARR